MNSISATLMPNYIVNSLLDNNRLYANKGYLEFIKYLMAQKQMCPLINSEIEAEFQRNASAGRNIYIKILRDLQITASNTFSYNIEVNGNTSAKQLVSVNTAFASFTHNPVEYAGNEIAEAEGFANQMGAAETALAKAIHDNVLTFLGTKKTQTLDITSVMNTGITFGSSVLSASDAAQRDNLLSQISVIMNDNGLDDRGLIGLMSSGFRGVLNEYAKYGANNDKNLQNQYGDIEAYISNTIPHSTKRFAGYLSRKGSHGAMFALPPVFQLQESLRRDGVTHFYQLDGQLPLLGNIPVGVLEISSPLDNGSNNLGLAKKIGLVVQWANVTNDILDRSTTASDIVYIEGATS